MALLAQHFTIIERPRNRNTSYVGPAVAPPHLLWTNRVRHAPTKAALSKPPPDPPLPHSSTVSVAMLASTPSPWRAYPNAFNCVSVTSDSFGSDMCAGFDTLTCPEKEQDLPPFEDCWEVLVLDAPMWSGYAEVEKYLARPLEAFEVFLAGVISQACGLKVPDQEELAIEGINLEGDEGLGGDATKRILSELKQSALEHGAVESFLRGDLVWDFGDVKGVTTPGNKASGGKNGGKGGGGNSTGGTGGGGGKDQVFAGVDLKKVGKDGIVAPPLPPPGSSNNGLTMNGSKKLNSNSNSANINGNINGKNRNASANGGQVNGSVNGTVRDKKEKVLEGLRDDKLALRLARSLFK